SSSSAASVSTRSQRGRSPTRGRATSCSTRTATETCRWRSATATRPRCCTLARASRSGSTSAAFDLRQGRSFVSLPLHKGVRGAVSPSRTSFLRVRGSLVRPWTGLLDLRGDPEEKRVAERRTDELDADWQPGVGPGQRQRDRGLSRHVEGGGEGGELDGAVELLPRIVRLGLPADGYGR